MCISCQVIYRIFYFAFLFALVLANSHAFAVEQGQVVFVSSEDNQIYSSINGVITQHTFPPFAAKSPRWSPRGDYIAYITRPDIFSGNELFITPTNPGGVLQLTLGGNNQHPTWSPDGKRIAFARGQRNDVRSDIYVLDVETKSTVQLTDFGAINVSPDWSPDGREIVFVSHLFQGAIPRIEVMNADGTSRRPLFDSRRSVGEPKWSPSGRYIAYRGKVDIPPEARFPQIYIVSANQELTRVTNEPLFHGTAAWSPDGKEIVYAAGIREGETDLYIIRIADGQITQITDYPGPEFEPTWSPDGKQIAFVWQNNGQLDIYRISRDGGNLTRLTNHEARDRRPMWSPDGDAIAFGRSGDIFLMGIDGENPINLTRDGSSVVHAWSPEGNQIAFFNRNGDDAAIFTMERNGANRTKIHETPNLRVQEISWSPDGRVLAYICFQDEGRVIGSQVCLFDLEARVEEIPFLEWIAPRAVQWAPFAKHYLIVSRPSPREFNPDDAIFVIDRNGVNPKLIFTKPNLNGLKGRLSWSPDESEILFGGESSRLYIVDIETGNRRTFMTDAHSPDWIDPPQTVLPRHKQITSWGRMKQKNTH